jgi:hypothetical protein
VRKIQWCGKSLRVQFMLAELDLAVTFCRLLGSKRSRHRERMLRNAPNVLFDAMHFVCESQRPGQVRRMPLNEEDRAV